MSGGLSIGSFPVMPMQGVSQGAIIRITTLGFYGFKPIPESIRTLTGNALIDAVQLQPEAKDIASPTAINALQGKYIIDAVQLQPEAKDIASPTAINALPGKAGAINDAVQWEPEAITLATPFTQV